MTCTTNTLLFILLYVSIFMELYCFFRGGGWCSCFDVNNGVVLDCKSVTTCRSYVFIFVSFMCRKFYITLSVVLTVNLSKYAELSIFCISEWSRGFKVVISLSFLFSCGEVKQTVTQELCKALQH
jgi:hypothetical protein